jgi:lipid-A-disaccharide synthase
MANLIAGRRVVPELIQDDFTAPKIVEQIELLLPDGPPRESMKEGLREIGDLLRTRWFGLGEPDVGAIDRVAAITLEWVRSAVPAGTATAV